MIDSETYRALSLLRASHNVLAVTPDPRATTALLYETATRERVRVVRIDGPELSEGLFEAATALARLDPVIVALADPALVDGEGALSLLERLARLPRVTVFLPVTLACAAALARRIVRLDAVVAPILEISSDTVRAVAELVGAGIDLAAAERVASGAGGSWTHAIALAHAAARSAATVSEEDLEREAARVPMPEGALCVTGGSTSWTC